MKHGPTATTRRSSITRNNELFRANLCRRRSRRFCQPKKLWRKIIGTHAVKTTLITFTRKESMANERVLFQQNNGKVHMCVVMGKFYEWGYQFLPYSSLSLDSVPVRTLLISKMNKMLEGKIFSYSEEIIA